jgi:hypothetical protein
VTAGICGLAASVGGRDAAHQEDILLAAGEKRQIGLTVPADVWQSIVAGQSETVTLGGAMVVAAEPMRRLYEDTSLVVLAVAGKSVAVRQQEFTS